MLILLGSTLLVLCCLVGPGWAVAARLALDPAEKIAAAIVLSLIFTWLAAWTIYVGALPTAALWLIPAGALASLALGWKPLVQTLRAEENRELLLGQFLVTAWSVGWLALILSYSGGDWIADWFGHWERARFFLERPSPTRQFYGQESLTARPPLLNVVMGAWLQVTSIRFAPYQLYSTLLNSLVFLPAALLARRWGGTAAIRLLAVLMMVCPLFVQNVTYAWTKLATAFLVLTALHFFLGRRGNCRPGAAGWLVGASLGAACIAHYSAGPFVVVLVVAWLAYGWKCRRDGRWWRDTAIAAGLGAVLLATWFAWAAATFGWRGTLLSHPSVTDAATTSSEQLMRALLNIRNTLVPHFLREVDFSAFAQVSRWGYWRDWSFQLYQRNLFLATGSVAWLAILVLLARRWRGAPIDRRTFWLGLAVGTTVLGIAAHGGADLWGNVHICEQPLIIIALAFLAAAWPQLSLTWRRFLCVGGAVDLVVGVGLQIGVQSFLLEDWFSPGRSPSEQVARHSVFARWNFEARDTLRLDFLGATLPSPPALVLALLGCLLALALVRAGRVVTASPPGAAAEAARATGP